MDKDSLEYASRILTHREELDDREVAEWLEDSGHRELLDHLASVRQRLKPGTFDRIKAAEWERLSRKVKKPRILGWYWRISVAAMIVLLLGVGGWFWLHSRQHNQASYPLAENGIQPGSIRAELILSGGKIVLLGNKTIAIDDRQVKGIVNDSAGVLNYTRVSLQKSEIVYNTLKVPVGGFYKVELPDGSRVWLNAASELKFPVAFTGPKREVYLKGEGYFEVSKDTARQFVVHLQKSEVTVLGTVFNINAYEEENHIYTTLAEGSVAFYSRQQDEQVVLKPGMQSDMDLTTGETTLAEVDPSVYTAWTQGRFIFQSISLEAMMRQLQRWYGFEVFYRKQALKNYRFRGVINRDMGIREVLDIIEETTDVEFDIDKRTVIAR